VARRTCGGLCWVVDPIDGHGELPYGLPWYAVSVAVQRDGRQKKSSLAACSGTARMRIVERGARMWATCDGVALRVRQPLSWSCRCRTGLSYRPERRPQARHGAGMLPRIRDLRARVGCPGSRARWLCGLGRFRSSMGCTLGLGGQAR